MSEPRRGLGRGLSALLGEMSREVAAAPARAEAADGDGVRTIEVAAILPNPDQPRRVFDEDALDELAQSLRARGLIQPIVVRPRDGGYQIVAGERRWRAAQRAGLAEVPALVRTLADGETLELAIIENVQRQDLNAIEEAEAYQRLAADFGHTQDALGRLVGKSRSHVANLLRLLDLPGDVRAAVSDGRLSMGHARALVTAADPSALAAEAIARGLSVRETEALAKRDRPARAAGPAKGGSARGGDADIDALERHLSDLIGLTVAVAHGPAGGQVTIAYASLDQLDMICQRLSGGEL